jgi:hypothetical protein
MCHFHEVDEQAIEWELEREESEETAEPPAQEELEEPDEPAVMADGGEE